MGKVMRNEDITILFNALGQILYNQDKLNKHLGLNKHDSEWGYEDTNTKDYARQCYKLASEYENLDNDDDDDDL